MSKLTRREHVDYNEFLARKQQRGADSGFEPIWMPDFLYDFQESLETWAIRKGRGLLAADCGLGKTPLQLVWAENVLRKTNKPVLILTPLAVSYQTVQEAAKFGIEAYRCVDGKHHGGIVVTNYEKLHYFDRHDFGGVVCDESSCIKHAKAQRRKDITEFMREIPYRLLCTATAAPNDYFELGTSSDALGYLGHQDMLTRFFKEDTAKDYLGWGRKSFRFRGHAELHFWRWVCSWARACRRPSDLGFADDKFVLPPLTTSETLVEASRLAPGQLFAMPACGLREQRAERRQTIEERCQCVADKLNDTGQSFVAWCHLNDEGILLDKLIPDAMEVAGRHSDEVKEERLRAFAAGEIRGIVTKPKIASFGLNWPHCNHMTFFPSHSFEQYYQAVRRCWRFGQERPVHVEIITTEGEQAVKKNLQRKADAADKMFSSLVAEMNNSMELDRSIEFTEQERLPLWM